jgi:hypothetical protein
MNSNFFPKRPAPRHPTVLLALLVLGVALGAGCVRNKQVIDFNPDFSMNVVKTPPWFPGKLDLTPAESNVIFKMGKPDLIRYWWRPDGSLITSSDLTGKDPAELGEQLRTMDQTWIYQREKQEVYFENNERDYEVKPLDELMELVCLYGDPSHRSAPRAFEGQMRETWQWIEYGLQIQLLDGKIVERSHFQATGQGTWGLK